MEGAEARHGTIFLSQWPSQSRRSATDRGVVRRFTERFGPGFPKRRSHEPFLQKIGIGRNIAGKAERQAVQTATMKNSGHNE
jgi:hypothetical protein